MNKITLPAIFIVSLASVIYSQSKGDILFLKGKEGEFYIVPNGEKGADIFQDLPLEVLEEYKGWIKVQATGWVKKKSLNLEKKSILKIISFNRKILAKDPAKGRETEKIKISLNIKNKGKKTITSWEGLLTVKNVIGETLFRFRLKNKGLNVSPQGMHKVDVEFEPGQFNVWVYNYLKSSAKRSLNLELNVIRFEND